MENYFMHYDPITGDILGFYLKSMHGDSIPSPTIEITEEKHNFYMENNGMYKLNPATLEDELIPVVVVDPATLPPTTEDRLSAMESAISALMGVQNV